MASTKKRKKTQTTRDVRTKEKNTQKNHNQSFMRDDVTILLSLAICIFLMISHFGIGGFIGDALSAFLFGVFGFIAYIVPILAFIGIAFIFSNKGKKEAYIKASCVLVLFILCCTLFQLIINGYDVTTTLKGIYEMSSVHKDGGGWLGGLLVNLLCPAIGVVGTYIIVIVLFILSFVILTGKSFVGAIKQKGETVYQNRKEKAEIKREKKQQIDEQEEKPHDLKRVDKVVKGVSFNTTIEKPTSKNDIHKNDMHEIEPPVEPAEDLFEFTNPTELVIDRVTPIAEEEDFVELEKEETATRKRRSTIESRETAATEAENVEKEIKKSSDKPKKAYKYPPMNLLTKGKATGGDSDAYLRETARKLEQTLRTFNVKATVTNVSCGPSVTRYELQPEMGVKVSKIVQLADDIKLNLEAADIRIEAPIPGKAAVGIEVPNKENTAVMLRDLLESSEFKTHSSKIAFAAGRDIAGKVVVADIAKMPHVLIAGATGSGKSVCINTLIMSIIYKASPEEVKMIMIDPKVVELKVYNGIPHLLIPVVTDPKKAAGALNWAVAEMTRRYQLFADCNVRDLKGYNAKVESLQELEAENKPDKLPQIVIIVDELADLMMVAPGEVEDAICRLAQLARACGIHLVVATQRPSVNVITGLIKANMPSRIAFSVSSGVDSRTIIDMNGAEKLLGKGDMLFYPAGYPKPVRVQGSFVSDEEVQAVVDYLVSTGNGAEYSEEITNHINSAHTMPGGSSTGGDERDEYFIYAGKFVIESDKGSIGMLQRKFKIGFNRAARIMDQLADAGVVGPEEGTKPRKVLMSMEQFEDYVDEYV